ncbi:MAG: DUF6596 domain-containing protein [Aeromicrobium sp.]
MSGRAADSAEAVFREEWGRLLATLVRWVGDLDLAEEVAAEAIAVALERWPVDGVPDNPAGWLLTTARRRAVDLLRRRQTYAAKLAILRVEAERAETEPFDAPAGDPDVIGDDRLRLFFTCCHPALAAEARVALTLRYLAGLSTAEVARAFLVPDTTMAQRLVRAKRKIREAGIPYRVPSADELPTRLPAVLSVVYVVFTEAYAASHGPALIRPELADEAIRLGRILHRLLPAEREVAGLLALMLLTEARRSARFVDDALVALGDQDRTTWDRALIAEGHALVRECLARNQPGHYQLMAAINAVHTDAATADATDWGQVATLYNQLYAVSPTPVVALNRSIAIAELDGPAVGLALLEPLQLTGYHPWHAARADLLRRLDRFDEARAAYDAAIQASGNLAERAWLAERRDRL